MRQVEIVYACGKRLKISKKEVVDNYDRYVSKLDYKLIHEIDKLNMNDSKECEYGFRLNDENVMLFGIEMTNYDLTNLIDVMTYVIEYES